MTMKELFLEATRRQNEGDEEGFLAMQSDECEWFVAGVELQGRDAVREWRAPMNAAFPGSTHEYGRIDELEDGVFAEGVWRGVQSGPLQTPQGEVPPTGREVTTRYAIVVRGDAATAQASSVHVYYDQLEFLAQLGLIPEPAAA
jgi:hypothetical protein